jgi:hypothetical protein
MVQTPASNDYMNARILTCSYENQASPRMQLFWLRPRFSTELSLRVVHDAFKHGFWTGLLDDTSSSCLMSGLTDDQLATIFMRPMLDLCCCAY